MASVQPLPNSAYVKVEVDFTSNWNTATPSFTDVTQDIRFSAGLTWDRGRNDEYQDTNPGSSEGALNNRSRTYDPNTNANMVPARPYRITCYYPNSGSTAYQQFDGMVEDWVPRWTTDGDAIVQFQAVEKWAALAFCNNANAGFLTNTSQARLNALADGAGWPAAARSFNAGQYQIGPETIQAENTLDAMKATAASQNQLLYETRDGILSSKSRFQATSASIGTFGDQAGELKYAGIDDSVGGGYWYTQVQVNASGPAWTQGQPNSVTKFVGVPYQTTKYGIRTVQFDIAAIGQANAQSVCNSIAASLAAQDPFRIKSVSIRPMADPANLFPVVLAADLGNAVTFKLTPPGGGGRITQNAKIRSVRHEISADDWLITWTLSQ